MKKTNLLNESEKKTQVMTEFRIVGDEFGVDEVTETLKIQPTEVFRKGEAIRDTGKKRYYTLWQYSTGYEEISDVKIQLYKIRELFQVKMKELLELKTKYHLEFVLSIVLVIKRTETPAIKFDTDFLNFAARIGMSFDLDLYVD